MAQTPVYGWPVPLRTDAPAGADQITALGLAIETTMEQELASVETGWQGDLAEMNIAGTHFRYASTTGTVSPSGGITIGYGATYASGTSRPCTPSTWSSPRASPPVSACGSTARTGPSGQRAGSSV
jgi:hypothetical protein